MMGQLTEMAQIDRPPSQFSFEIQTLIIGAGAAGMTAALAAADEGQTTLIIERDAIPSGSTALSAGLIPAAGTRFQSSVGIDDNADIFAADIQQKANGENEQSFVDLLAENAAATIEWLSDKHALPFSLVHDFDYPGHSQRRMHGLPSRSGQELIDHLRSACEASDIDIICDATAHTIYVEDDLVRGIQFVRPDGSTEQIGCERLILACNGFGGNADKVRENMSNISDAIWFGHDGNKGEALDWGKALGAATKHLSAYQGHGNVAKPHGILISWAVITQGGVQVDKLGKRFWNEAQGYSEAARVVLAQPDGEAFAIFDEDIASVARQFTDFQNAEKQGAIKTGGTIAELANQLGLPAAELKKTLSAIPVDGTDQFGRAFSDTNLKPPFKGVKVTGALFHTQGGLCVDKLARVQKLDGAPFPNLFAAGGAAVGVSGSNDSGYLSGNGLLSAVVLGRIAGQA